MWTGNRRALGSGAASATQCLKADRTRGCCPRVTHRVVRRNHSRVPRPSQDPFRRGVTHNHRERFLQFLCGNPGAARSVPDVQEGSSAGGGRMFQRARSFTAVRPVTGAVQRRIGPTGATTVRQGSYAAILPLTLSEPLRTVEAFPHNNGGTFMRRPQAPRAVISGSAITYSGLTRAHSSRCAHWPIAVQAPGEVSP